MTLQVKLWRFTLTIVLLDVDTSDQDIEVKLNVSWRKPLAG